MELKMLSIALMASLGLVACTVTPTRVSLGAPFVVGIAAVAPPPNRVEIIPPAPGHEYFWVYGHWRWVGSQHQWVDGHWEQHREREHWVPHRWIRDGQGNWRLQEGHWRRD